MCVAGNRSVAPVWSKAGGRERLAQTAHLGLHGQRVLHLPDGRWLERMPGAPPLGRPSRRGTRCPSAMSTACHPTGKRSVGDQHRRASGSPGPSAARARLPGVTHPPRVTLGAAFAVAEDNTPFRYHFGYPRDRHRVSRDSLAPLRFARILPNPTLRLGAESGAGSGPPPIVRSTAPQSGLLQALLLPVGGRSQPRLQRDRSLREGYI